MSHPSLGKHVLRIEVYRIDDGGDRDGQYHVHYGYPEAEPRAFGQEAHWQSLVRPTAAESLEAVVEHIDKWLTEGPQK